MPQWNSRRKSRFPRIFVSYFPRRPSPSSRRCRNTHSAGMLPRTAAIPRSIAGSRLVSYRGAQGKLTNGIRVDAILGHVSAHGLAICLKSHNAYTSHHYHHHRWRRRRRRCFLLLTRFPTLFVSTLLAIPYLASLFPRPRKTLFLEDVALPTLTPFLYFVAERKTCSTICLWRLSKIICETFAAKERGAGLSECIHTLWRILKPSSFETKFPISLNNNEIQSRQSINFHIVSRLTELKSINRHSNNVKKILRKE